jgi:hypothetical protein
VEPLHRERGGIVAAQLIDELLGFLQAALILLAQLPEVCSGAAASPC